MGRQKSASSQVLKVEELEELEETQSGEGHTTSGVGERNYTVHQIIFSVYTELCVADVCVDTSRQV
jgi:hypothetical protein